MRIWRVLVLLVLLAAPASAQTLTWDPSVPASPDPADKVLGYKVYSGATCGPWTSVVDVGDVLSYAFAQGQAPACFAVAAYAHYTTPEGVVQTIESERSDPVQLSAPPTITCPASVSASSLDGNPVAVNFGAPIVTDGQAPVVTSVSQASGSLFPVGQATITATATDALSRTASCQFTVTVTAPPPPNPCLTAAGANVLAVSIKASQSPVKAPGPGYVVFQVLDFAGKPLTSIKALLSDGSTVSNIDPSIMANIRVWSGIWIRPSRVGNFQLFIRVTNSDGCSAESQRVPIKVQ